MFPLSLASSLVTCVHSQSFWRGVGGYTFTSDATGEGGKEKTKGISVLVNTILGTFLGSHFPVSSCVPRLIAERGSATTIRIRIRNRIRIRIRRRLAQDSDQDSDSNYVFLVFLEQDSVGQKYFFPRQFGVDSFRRVNDQYYGQYYDFPEQHNYQQLLFEGSKHDNDGHFEVALNLKLAYRANFLNFYIYSDPFFQ